MLSHPYIRQPVTGDLVCVPGCDLCSDLSLIGNDLVGPSVSCLVGISGAEVDGCGLSASVCGTVSEACDEAGYEVECHVLAVIEVTGIPHEHENVLLCAVCLCTGRSSGSVGDYVVESLLDCVQSGVACLEKIISGDGA